MTRAVTSAPWPSWLLMALLVIALPLLVLWPLGLAANLYDEKRLLVVTLLAVCAVLLALGRPLRLMWQARIASLPRGVARTLFIVLLLGVLSSARAQLPLAALTEVAFWVLLLSLLVMVAALRIRLQQPFDRAMIGILALILFVYLLVTSGYLLQALSGARALDLRQLFLNFAQLRFFNQFQSWTLPLAVLPVLYAQRRGWTILQWLLLLAAANWWLLLLLSGARGVLVAITIATVVVALLFGRRVGRWLTWQGIALLGGAALYLLVSWLMAALLERAVESPGLLRTTLSRRDQLWELALGQISAHPLLGVGPMHYACSEPPLAGHPHNALLQIGAEWGLPALLLLSALLLWIFYRAVQQARSKTVEREEMDLAPLLLLSLLTAAIHAQVSGVIVTPISQLMFAIIGGWLWGVLSPATKEEGRWRVVHTLWSGVMAVSLLLLAHAVSPLWRDAINGTIPQPDQTRLYMPHFWIDGEICREGSPWQR